MDANVSPILVLVSVVVYLICFAFGTSYFGEGIRVVRKRTYVYSRRTGAWYKLEQVEMAGKSTIPVGISITISGLIFITGSLVGLFSSWDVLGTVFVMTLGGVIVRVMGDFIGYLL